MILSPSKNFSKIQKINLVKIFIKQKFTTGKVQCLRLKGKQFVDTGKQTVNKYRTEFFVHFVRQLNDSILSNDITIEELVILHNNRSKFKNEIFHVEILPK